MGFWNFIRSMEDSSLRTKFNHEYEHSHYYDRDTDLIRNTVALQTKFDEVQKASDRKLKDRKIEEFNRELKRQGIMDESYDSYEAGYCNIYALNEKDSAQEKMNQELDPIKKCSMKRLYDNQIYNFEDLY